MRKNWNEIHFLLVVLTSSETCLACHLLCVPNGACRWRSLCVIIWSLEPYYVALPTEIPYFPFTPTVYCVSYMQPPTEISRPCSKKYLPSLHNKIRILNWCNIKIKSKLVWNWKEIEKDIDRSFKKINFKMNYNFFLSLKTITNSILWIFTHTVAISYYWIQTEKYRRWNQSPWQLLIDLISISTVGIQIT